LTWVQVIVSVLTPLATLGAAFLGAWLSPRRYRSERLWDRKLETYTEIFNAINQLQEEYDALWDEATVNNSALAPEFRSALSDATAKARAQLRKQSRIGSFIISSSAEQLLRTLLAEMDREIAEHDYFEHIDRNAAVIASTALNLKEVARRDIKA
jgi:hypothetical protein